MGTFRPYDFCGGGSLDTKWWVC